MPLTVRVVDSRRRSIVALRRCSGSGGGPCLPSVCGGRRWPPSPWGRPRRTLSHHGQSGDCDDVVGTAGLLFGCGAHGHGAFPADQGFDLAHAAGRALRHRRDRPSRHLHRPFHRHLDRPSRRRSSRRRSSRRRDPPMAPPPGAPPRPCMALILNAAMTSFAHGDLVMSFSISASDQSEGALSFQNSPLANAAPRLAHPAQQPVTRNARRYTLDRLSQLLRGPARQ